LAEAAALKDAAESANRAKSDFLANMSHEIRTPMNAVQGFIELALDSSCRDEEQLEYLHTAKSSAGFLLSVINDILDFSKIEAHQLTLESVVFSLTELIEGVTGLFSQQTAQNRLRLVTNIDPGVPDFVRSDPTRMRQVLINLMGNAMKFTSSGSIVCGAAFSGDALHFTVADTGIGIPLDRQESIFGAFTQADQSICRRFGGTGLGLAICKRIVEAAGGRIWVDSQTEKGSTFHFTWPVEVALSPDPLIPVAVSKEPGALSILVAEDNLVNQRLICAILTKMGNKVTLASDGDEACRAHENQIFDAILMDVQMPRMNGLDATREIRKRERLLGMHTRIIALTAAASELDCAACLSAGMDAYLTKPIQKQQLSAELAFCSGLSSVAPLLA
jgi:CheY-like chemotaxis protein